MEAAGKVWTHWSKCHEDILAEQNKYKKISFRASAWPFFTTKIPWACTLQTQQPHYSLDKQIWTYWTQTQNKLAVCRQAPCVIRGCLSFSLCLWGSVCLTLVWLSLLSSWSHQSVWEPVKAISHLAVWLPASTVPVSAVRDGLKPTQAPSLLRGPKAALLPHSAESLIRGL